MTDVTSRPYQPQDADAVKELIDEAFSIGRFVEAPHLLDGALEVGLRTCLQGSSYAQVAVQDGRAVGVLMGRVAGQRRLGSGIAQRLATWWHMARLLVLGIGHWSSLLQFFRFGTVYRALRARTTAPTTDELTLFAVAGSTRGLGVGTRLYDGYQQHLREHGRTDFFLYTDTRCTYGFYERRGMTRAASQDVAFRFDGTPETLGVFLYTGAVVPRKTVRAMVSTGTTTGG